MRFAVRVVPLLVVASTACSSVRFDAPRTAGRATMDDGVAIAYTVVGDGPQTVIVPMGILTEQAMAPLATRGRRLVFYDPRNRGRSDRAPLDAVHFDRQIADVEQLRQHLGADSVALIGWSGLGMQMAVSPLAR